MKLNEKNLAAFSIAPTVVQREGLLLKRGEVNRAFQKRWFVLKGNLLFYFERCGDREPLGVIIMEGCTIELTECEEQVCSFRIIFPGREYVLAAENQELLEGWMKSLARASYSYLKMMVAELEMQLEELNTVERRRAEEEAAVSTDGACGVSPLSSVSRQRLNPFNTSEENRIFVQLWDGDGAEAGRGHETSTAAMSRHRSNTVTSATAVWHHHTGDTTSSDSVSERNSNSVAPLIPDLASSCNDINSNFSVAGSNNITKAVTDFNRNPATPFVVVRAAPPIPPARHKKSSQAKLLLGGGERELKPPPNVNQVKKSNSSVSVKSITSNKSNQSYSSSSSGLSSTSTSSIRQYFPFAQLHMDYGAPILRDWELHRLKHSTAGVLLRSPSGSTEAQLSLEASSCCGGVEEPTRVEACHTNNSDNSNTSCDSGVSEVSLGSTCSGGQVLCDSSMRSEERFTRGDKGLRRALRDVDSLVTDNGLPRLIGECQDSSDLIKF